MNERDVELREKTGTVSTTDPLVVMWYLLAKEYLNLSQTEELLGKIRDTMPGSVVLNNGWLGNYAIDLAGQIDKMRQDNAVGQVNLYPAKEVKITIQAPPPPYVLNPGYVDPNTRYIPIPTTTTPAYPYIGDPLPGQTPYVGDPLPGQTPYVGDPLPGQTPYVGDPLPCVVGDCMPFVLDGELCAEYSKKTKEADLSETDEMLNKLQGKLPKEEFDRLKSEVEEYERDCDLEKLFKDLTIEDPK
jgi:hypothetical protein